MKLAIFLAVIHCFSHKHVLFILNRNCLLIVLFFYPLFEVDACSLGSQHMTFLEYMAEGFFLYYLIIFLNDQLKVDHSSHFKLTSNKSCILWRTDICRTVLVWKSFKHPVTTLSISDKEQPKPSH